MDELSVGDLCELLTSLNLRQYVGRVREEEVDGAILSELIKAGDLGELISDKIHQAKLRAKLCKNYETRVERPIAVDMPAKFNQKWSKEEEEQLLREIDEEIPIEEIMRKHERTKGGIRGRMNNILIKNILQDGTYSKFMKYLC